MWFHRRLLPQFPVTPICQPFHPFGNLLVDMTKSSTVEANHESESPIDDESLWKLVQNDFLNVYSEEDDNTPR